MGKQTAQVVAKMVERRRVDLGMSRDAAARKAGINRVTWARVESGERIQQVNLAKVERTLGWEAGHLSAILAGHRDPDADVMASVSPMNQHRRSTDRDEDDPAWPFERTRARVEAYDGYDPKTRNELLDLIDEAETMVRRVVRRIPNDQSA